jgi:DNA-binding response OmpR family regulator
MAVLECGLILVVEDHPTIAELIGECLERIGYDIDFAHDGVEALGRLEDRAYDLVILDRSLPRLDGVEVCRRIAGAKGARPSILMLTAHEAWADKVTALEAGADDYLTKPFAPTELQARVAALIDRHRGSVPGTELQAVGLAIA